MKLRSNSNGVQIDVKVKPMSREFAFFLEFGEIVVHCRATPENGKANRELIKELSKLFGCRVMIVSGLASRHKTLELVGVDVNKVRYILETKNQ